MHVRLSSTRCAVYCGAAAAAGLVFSMGMAPAHASARPAASYSYTVNSTADSHDAKPGNGICADSQGRCTLRAAIEAASADPSGSKISITVPAGTYDLTLGTLIESANTIKIAGAGSGSTLVEGNKSFGILRIDSGVTATLANVTISDGNAGNSGYGGGVLTSGTTTISDSVISGNTASAGGGVANSGGSLTLKSSTVSGNDATEYGGGGLQNGGVKNLPGSVTVTKSTIDNNTSTDDGGGILNGQNGHPSAAGPAVLPQRWRAGSRPGAAQRDTAQRETARQDAARRGTVRRDAARPASAPYKLTLTVTSSDINDNHSGNAGGGIANDGGTTTVTGTTLSGNTCPHAIGGGIETYGPLTVTGSTLSGNSAAGGYGGGIETYYGGVSGSTSITTTTLSDNSAQIGGAIDDSNAVGVSQSTLSGNTAEQSGGAIEVEGSASVSVINSTIAGNTTTMSGNGGGIQTYACGGGTVSYTTISGNSTGLDLSCSTLTLTGTIVANSTGGKNCTGSTPAETYGYNLDSGTSCGFSKPTDLNSTGPKLNALADNGGPTLTELPKPGSPVINAGGNSSNGCPDVDQRGDPRPYGPACDIGSVEVQG